jgi:hypothetical protein
MRVPTGILQGTRGWPLIDQQTESCRRSAGGPHGARRNREGGLCISGRALRVLREKLPEVSFSCGKFGENLTTAGLTEASLHR